MAKYVTVSTIAYNAVEKGENYRHDDFLARTHEKARTLIEQAAQAKPDIVCLPEVWNGLGLGDDMYEHAEPIPGPTTDMCAKLAKKHKMYIVCPIFERRGKKLYNTAAFIDRRGHVIGKYHKYQPTIGEMEHGVIPGLDAPAFDLDFGPVGAAICFDMKFVEVSQCLARNGARMVIFASMFVAGERLRHWARDIGAYIVSSCPRHSYIIDMSGRTLKETGPIIPQVAGGLVPPIATATVNMDRWQFHLDYNQGRIPDIVKKYGAGVDIEVYSPEAHFTLASLMDDVTVADLIQEFELEPYNVYLNRARKFRDKTLKSARRTRKRK